MESASLDSSRRVPEIQWLRLLGDASYSIYLTHLFAIGAVLIIWNRFGLLQTSGIKMVLFVLLGSVASVALGVLFHLRVERPLIESFRHRRAIKQSVL
jgi:exopolysaccharide production protein ExoZ